MVNPNINSFGQTPIQGQLDLSAVGGNVFAARVSSNIGNGVTLIAGQAVKGDNATPGTAQDGIFPVLPLASNSDPAIGFVKYSIKDSSFGVNQRLELAMADTVMYMTSDSTTVGINRFGPVEYNATANTVLAWQGINPIIGFAFDAAINAGDVIRVRISSPQISAANTSQSIKNITVLATLAQINAGLTLISGITGKKITVTGYSGQVIGTFATGTGIYLQSTNVSPVRAATILTADIAGTGDITPNSANTTLGVGFGGPLGSGDGFQVIKDGATALTGGTSIQFNISYTQS